MDTKSGRLVQGRIAPPPQVTLSGYQPSAADPGDTLIIEDSSGSLLLESGDYLLLQSSP